MFRLTSRPGPASGRAAPRVKSLRPTVERLEDGVGRSSRASPLLTGTIVDDLRTVEDVGRRPFTECPNNSLQPVRMHDVVIIEVRDDGEGSAGRQDRCAAIRFLLWQSYRLQASC